MDENETPIADGCDPATCTHRLGGDHSPACKPAPAKRYIVIAIMDNDPVGAIECDSEETANLLAAATEERFMDVRAWVQYIGVADVVTKDTIAETLDELDGENE